MPSGEGRGEVWIATRSGQVLEHRRWDAGGQIWQTMSDMASPLATALILWPLPIWGALLILVAVLVLRGAARFSVLAFGPALLFGVMLLVDDIAFDNGNLLAALIYTCGWSAISCYYPVFFVVALLYAFRRRRQRRTEELRNPVPDLRNF